MRQRVAWSRDKVAQGHPVATVARIANISRQALYKTPKPRNRPQSREITDPIEQKIVDTCNDSDYQTDGYRMIAAIVSRLLKRPVNRKRVLRVMRKHNLIQRRRRPERRRRPGKFKVTRPDQLWHLDMTSVWVAEHGWTYLMAIIDCCTREIVGWQLTVRCRAKEAMEVLERSVAIRGIRPDQLTLGTDNGSQFTARRTKSLMRLLGVAHRRGGYRDPESQAFIESWFDKLKRREVWLNDYETLEDARLRIGRYVDRYHDRPHSSLNYRTPNEVARTWEEGQTVQKSAA